MTCPSCLGSGAANRVYTPTMRWGHNGQIVQQGKPMETLPCHECCGVGALSDPPVTTATMEFNRLNAMGKE